MQSTCEKCLRARCAWKGKGELRKISSLHCSPSVIDPSFLLSLSRVVKNEMCDGTQLFAPSAVGTSVILLRMRCELPSGWNVSDWNSGDCPRKAKLIFQQLVSSRSVCREPQVWYFSPSCLSGSTKQSQTNPPAHPDYSLRAHACASLCVGVSQLLPLGARLSQLPWAGCCRAVPAPILSTAVKSVLKTAEESNSFCEQYSVQNAFLYFPTEAKLETLCQCPG